MDMTKSLESTDRIEKIHWLQEESLQKPLDLVFFMCPRRQGRFQVNPLGTGLTIEYCPEPGVSESTLHHLRKISEVVETIRSRVLVGSITAVFSGADALILPSVPVEPGVPPEQIEEVSCRVVSNYQAVWLDFPRWAKLYHTRPWEEATPKWALDLERRRLHRLLGDFPEGIVSDFVRRVFAGFSLDGKLLREAEFGENPIILGIESPGVAVLQNAALGEDEKVPVIQVSGRFR